MIEQSNPEMLDLKILQEKDRDISYIREWVDKGEKPDSKDTASESYFGKSTNWTLAEVRNPWRTFNSKIRSTRYRHGYMAGSGP